MKRVFFFRDLEVVTITPCVSMLLSYVQRALEVTTVFDAFSSLVLRVREMLGLFPFYQ